MDGMSGELVCGGNVSVNLIPVRALELWLMIMKVTVTMPPGITASTLNDFLSLIPPAGGMQSAFGFCGGNRTPPDMHVTVAWLQISVLVVNVPVPVLKVQPAPFSGLQLELL